MPRYACGLPCQASAIETPSASRMRYASEMSVTLKPVASTIVSTSCFLPSAVTIPSGWISRMPSVTSSTLGCWSAGYHSFEGRIRLQPST